jgi:hypothetical protein
MSATYRLGWPVGAGLVGALLLAMVYLGIVSLAESPRHAVDLFWQDRLIVVPIMLGFGVQLGLYVTLKKRLFVPVASMGPSGPLAGVSGTTSTVAMVACCAHHVTDVLPILGLTAAATFLAEYRVPFMLAGLGMTLLGIVIMVIILLRERHKVVLIMEISVEGV